MDAGKDQGQLVLYILGVNKNDLASMNPGKFAAQACHAAQVFANKCMTEKFPLYSQWKDQTDGLGYGTVIALSCSQQQLLDIKRKFFEIRGPKGYCEFQTIVDPTYPFIVEDREVARMLVEADCKFKIVKQLDDGRFLMTRPEVTCGYLFGYSENPDIKALVGHLNLYP